MAKYSSWIHGTSIISQIQSTNALEQVNTGNGGIENTDVLGYSDSTILGPSFREWCGKWFQSKGNVPNVFMCAIPTPTTIHDVRPTLTNVMALYKADPSVSLVEVAIFDGPNAVGAYDQNKVATFASTNNNGTNGPQDLIEGSTNFSIGNFLSPSFQPVASLALNWGLCLALRFQFSKDNGRILFTAAGADFQG
jgi:hypothetical protein